MGTKRTWLTKDNAVVAVGSIIRWKGLERHTDAIILGADPDYPETRVTVEKLVGGEGTGQWTVGRAYFVASEGSSIAEQYKQGRFSARAISQLAGQAILDAGKQDSKVKAFKFYIFVKDAGVLKSVLLEGVTFAVSVEAARLKIGIENAAIITEAGIENIVIALTAIDVPSGVGY